jgi:hypothetical protein
MNKEIMNKFFPEATKKVENGQCPLCDHEIIHYMEGEELVTEFDSPLSYKEYKISGLCQKCQNRVFSSND